jgi:hypothetical protein
MAGKPFVSGCLGMHGGHQNDIILSMFQCPAPIINIPPPPENHDFLKTIVAATLGLIAGLVAEPLKAMIMRWFTIRRIVDALYRELAGIYDDLEIQMNVGDAMSRMGMNLLDHRSSVIFNHYYKENNELFLEEKRLSELSSVFTDLQIIAGMLEADATHSARAAELKDRLDMAISIRTLDGNRLDRLRKKLTKEMKDKLKLESNYRDQKEHE